MVIQHDVARGIGEIQTGDPQRAAIEGQITGNIAEIAVVRYHKCALTDRPGRFRPCRVLERPGAGTGLFEMLETDIFIDAVGRRKPRDLGNIERGRGRVVAAEDKAIVSPGQGTYASLYRRVRDRKSTRLNSSH